MATLWGLLAPTLLGLYVGFLSFFFFFLSFVDFFTLVTSSILLILSVSLVYAAENINEGHLVVHDGVHLLDIERVLKFQALRVLTQNGLARLHTFF